MLLTDGENNQTPDPLEAAAGRRRPRCPDLHGRDRHGRRGDARDRRLPGPQPARRGGPAPDRRHDRRLVLRGRRSGRPDAVYDSRRDAPRRPARADGGHLAVRRRRAADPRRRRVGVPGRARAGAVRLADGRPVRLMDLAVAPAWLLRLPLLIVVRIWILRAAPAGRPLLEPVAGPRRRAALVADPPPPAVRPVPARPRQPRGRDGPAGGDRGRAGRPDHGRSSRSTCRAACAPRTSRRTGSTRPRQRPRRSSSSQSASTRIGIVAFAGFAEMVQAPTTDREVLLDVVASLATGRRTAIGSAILESIDAIAEIDPLSRPAARARTIRPAAPPPGPAGAYAAAIIVLLTDGASNAGPEPVDAAQQAADRGLRVYTDRLRDRRPGRPQPALRPAVHRRRAGRRFDPGGSAAAAASAAAAWRGGGGLPPRDRRGHAPRRRRRDRRRVLPGRERRRAQDGPPEPPDQHDHRATRSPRSASCSPGSAALLARSRSSSVRRGDRCRDAPLGRRRWSNGWRPP